MTITPAQSRTITLPLVLTENQVLRFPDKDPGDTLDYSVDLTNVLAETGDTLSSFTAAPVNAATSPALNITPEAIAGSVCTGMFSSGAIGTDYALQYIFNLASGVILNRTIWLRCRTLTQVHNNLGDPDV
jgi:hypothetical protein